MSDALRQVIFDDCAQRLADMAYRAINVLKKDPGDIVTVAIHVDDPAWTDLAEHLMPGTDWQAFRDRGEKPVARGTTTGGVMEYIAKVCPDICEAIMAGPPEGYLFAFVMDGGGASVYTVPYTPMIVTAEN